MTDLVLRRFVSRIILCAVVLSASPCHAQAPHEFRAYEVPAEMLDRLEDASRKQEGLGREQGADDLNVPTLDRLEVKEEPIFRGLGSRNDRWVGIKNRDISFSDFETRDSALKLLPDLQRFEGPPKPKQIARSKINLPMALLPEDKDLNSILKSLKTSRLTVFVRSEDIKSNKTLETEPWVRLRSLVDEKDIIIARKPSDLERAIKTNPNALVLLQKSRNPLAGASSLQQRVAGLEVIDALPQTAAEYKRTYDQEKPDNVELESDLESFQKGISYPVLRFATDPDAAIGKNRIADAVMNRLHRKEPSQLVLILAHVEDGLARFPDGSKLPTGDILRSGGVLVGCNTHDGAPSEAYLQLLTFQALSDYSAKAIVALVAAALRKQGDNTTMENMLRQLQNSLTPCTPRTVMAPCVLNAPADSTNSTI